MSLYRSTPIMTSPATAFERARDHNSGCVLQDGEVAVHMPERGLTAVAHGSRTWQNDNLKSRLPR